ncbi:hypothetical protein ACOSQ3_030140 [Xanthoceras sorbifolium]
MSAPLLVAIELHHVRYQKGDLLGQFLSCVSILPVYVEAALVSDFIHRREIQSLLVYIGQELANVVSLLMKASIKQRRSLTCDSYGWPSQHATFAFFHAVYSTLLSFRRMENRRWVVAAATWVYLVYHSVSQVIDGAVVGSCASALWFWVVNTVFSSYFPAIEESWIGRMLYLKDTSHLENVLKFEYNNARASRKIHAP